MKLPFTKRDYAAELAKAKADLAAARNQLVDLQQQRAAALGEAAVSVVEMRKIDRGVEELKATVVLLEDRCRRLAVLARKAEQERRERERDAAIDNIIAPKLANGEKLARDLEAAIAGLGDAFEALESLEDDLRQNWPQACPRPDHWSGPFSFYDVKRRLETAMGYADVPRLVEFTMLDRMQTISAAVAKQVEDSLAELRKVPIPLPPALNDDDDAEPAEVAAVEPVRGVLMLATTP